MNDFASNTHTIREDKIRELMLEKRIKIEIIPRLKTNNLMTAKKGCVCV